MPGMRTLKVFESISVDGYFADAAGEMSFAHAVPPDPDFAAWVSANASSESALLFGRKTYEMMESFWTSAAAAEQLPVVAKGMHAAKKYVVSKTAEPTWHNTQRLAGDLARAVTALKEQEGPPIVILGSGSVVAALGQAGLIDEYQFVVIPIALGAGRTLFSKRAKLRLVEQRAFKNGNLVVSYAR
jgi:dihydrofolate reductase